MKNYTAISLGVSALLLAGCSPTVKLEAPEKPIVIDMNVKLKVEKAADEAIKSNPDIF
jgi:hypothetical protein